MPTQVARVVDQTCAGQQQWPRVSSVICCPAGQFERGAQLSPCTSKPSGQAGMPTQSSREIDQACCGQQQ